MYRALYPFENDDSNVLCCKAGDKFTVLDSSDANWWLAQNGKGQVGYVPANYLAIDEVGCEQTVEVPDPSSEVAPKYL